MRSLLGTAIDAHADVTVVDMEAGLEHLSRSSGTLAYADVLLVVMEPSTKSVLTATRTQQLATELGIPLVYGLGNKAQLPDDADFFAELADRHGLRMAGVVPYDADVVKAERRGERLDAGVAADVRAAVRDVVELLTSPEHERAALQRRREDVEQRLAELGAADRQA